MWLEDNPDLEKKVFSGIGVTVSRKLEGGLVNSIYYVELKNGISGVLKIADNKTEDWVTQKERAVLSHFGEFPFFYLLRSPALGIVKQGVCCFGGPPNYF